MPIIEICNLGKVYRGKKRIKVDALTDLTLNVERGQVLGVLGPNGAGKSTTIKILTGQVKPSTGWARIDGCNAGEEKSRLGVGYLPENPSFYQFLSAREYLKFVGRVYGLDHQTCHLSMERVLERVELVHAAHRPIRGYSKGMVQRLGLAQALLHDPPLYILDEPMSGLDPLGRALVKQIINDLKEQGKTVFFSTHITSDVEEICDRVAVIVSGKLCALEKVETILEQGITGYRVVGRDSHDNPESFTAESAELKHTIQAYLGEGGHIEKIEPLRNNLEDFFLNTVKGETRDDR